MDYLLSLPTCNGRVGATGMCLGGHLAYRCALDQRVKAAVCYFATDIHSKTLGQGKNDDSLERAGDIKGELVMVSILAVDTHNGIKSRSWRMIDLTVLCRSSERTTTTFLPRGVTSSERCCMRRVCCSASMKWRGHSVSYTIPSHILVA